MVDFAVATLAVNLRVDANHLPGTKSSDPAKAQVMVHSLLYKTSEDLNIISKGIVGDYNSAYSATSYYLTALKTKSFTALKTKTSVSVPYKVGFTNSF